MAFPSPPSILSQRNLTAAELSGDDLTPAQLRLFAWMHLARRADNRILELFRQGLIKGTVTGGQGNEGLIVPLALLLDKATDVVSFTHRDFGGHLIWSGHLCEHLNQYFANAASPTQAREGNIHHGDPANRSLPMISHLGAMLSNVVGVTDAQRRAGHQAVGLCLFGDGGSSTGDIHETLNLASLLSLPILFVIENNHYAYSTPLDEQFNQSTPLWHRAAGYGIEGRHIDATDALSAADALADAVATVRTSGRPLLVEAKTLRLRGHAAYDTCDYLKPGESDGFFAADSLPKLRAHLVENGQTDAVAALETELNAFVESCIQHSLGVARPTPDMAKLTAEVFAPTAAPLPWEATPAETTELNFAQAINAALRKVLTERSESLILGQDIATYGGAFKVTDGLLNDFGRSRVFNTPLAESSCTGYAVGLALAGHRPIEEFQFSDFVTEAATQITLNAATYHFRSGAKVPLVLRMPCGGGLTFGSFHSQELESMLLSMPGIKALYPSTPQDAFNAVLAAVEDDNPVLLFEHKMLYRGAKGAVSWDGNYRKVWEPRHVAAGDYATVVTYGQMVGLATQAAAYFRDEYDYSFDIFDLRALSPLRLDAIKASLARTHRLIVLHEGRRSHGFGAELVAQLTEEHFFDLEAPPLRIASLDMPVPFAPELEAAYRPSVDSIIEKIADWIG
ncbi:alpha-ketoacid dehydrogenase subunit alpha/beta [Synoicihabitans lomoniglobus]|uniref:Thiamine pyrophosphate-dependent enzyme n=1 Tax=Synoicihabitans lomoniglobus TaxID=2909285 RepID=A0AAF0CPY3_9BACT|nr:thiamine pyrophosphate-dependent enzyme [Opitutaceae bacterium LMO-M01]WED65889.1 thiamine pyrophosphate-dependent enzyme [Opitutaceae bacterium LMO-M01]